MLLRFILGKPTLFYESDNGNNNGGGSSSSNNPYAQLVRERENENFQLRADKRELKTEVERLTKLLPPEGATILQGDDAKVWEAFKALNKPIADIQKELQEGEQAKGEISRQAAQKVYTDAASSYGWSGKGAVLSRLPSLQGKTLEPRTVTENGQQLQRWYVKDGSSETELQEHIRKHDADFIPALQAGATQEQQSNQQSNQQGNQQQGFQQQGGGNQQQQDGATWFRQANTGSNNGQGGGSYVETLLQKFQAERDQAYNPLDPNPSKKQG